MNLLFNLSAPVFGLVGRSFIAVMFVMAGFNKAMNYSDTALYLESLGIPGVVTPLVVLLELGGGIAIIVGWQTRLAALLLAGFTLMASFLAHANFSDQIQMMMFMKNIAVTGGFLFLVANGAGNISFDHYLAKRRGK